MNAGKTPKGVKTKDRIVESAIKLMNAKGIARTTLVEVCAASGVAQGTFYHYFKSINDILYEILRIEGEELLFFYEIIIDNSPLEKLNKVLNFQMDYYEKKGKAVVAQILGNEFIPLQGDSLIEKLLPIRAFVSGIISEGQETGVFSDRNSAEKDSIVLMALILTYSYMWIRDKTDNPLKEIAGSHINDIIEQLILK
ncbi:MAG: TetR/AcrR family transcriptional regulator [Spirochaetales bacterium]|nr:TetR/AcrR family transcriptional regulator [Spirochaetales bacterium]